LTVDGEKKSFNALQNSKDCEMILKFNCAVVLFFWQRRRCPLQHADKKDETKEQKCGHNVSFIFKTHLGAHLVAALAG
jgi:hypothetical protein